MPFWGRPVPVSPPDIPRGRPRPASHAAVRARRHARLPASRSRHRCVTSRSGTAVPGRLGAPPHLLPLHEPEPPHARSHAECRPAHPNPIRSDLGLLVRSLREHGVARTVTNIKASILYRLCQIQGRRHDERFGVETSRLIHLDDLTTAADDLRGTNYVGSATGPVRHAIGLLPRRPEELTFVDLGCGPGRVLMLAAEAQFKEVVGWDIAFELVEAGRANIERFRQVSGNETPVRLEVADASRASLPDGPCVLHFFSPPYRDPVLGACLLNAHRSHEENLRDLFVILVNDHDRNLTRDFPFLSRVEPTRSRLAAALMRWAFSVNVWRIR